MINDILHMERDLLATLTTLKQLIIELELSVENNNEK